jgi:L-aspartate oxidase
VARVLVAAARLREETRGCHWREDHADRDDTDWRRHIVVRLHPDRTLALHTTDTADFPPTLPQALGAARAGGTPMQHQEQ